MPVPPEPRRALIAGATGLVGGALLQQLLVDPLYGSVQVLLRRPWPPHGAHPKLRQQVVDFQQLPPLAAVDDAFIALGTTIRVAGSQAAFRAVDFDAVLNTARAARAARARRVLIVSALGADAHSRAFYNRVKGEMEHAVAALGIDSVVFAQPSLLLGDRAALGQPPRTAEAWAMRLSRPLMRWLPRSVRPIAAHDVALALREAARSAGPGVHRLRSAQMQPA